ncbi:flavin reductase family protein [Lutibacter flavus]|uniref:NADH-FMN oxidoreductase RutF, flavin reductase (DIM6/NTAB) family n=1 Tax=Lutibacter flavus TaxID=691689 RepID=A0A238VTB0_9FLAO|nr:flavin reductase [Lutibacter flavus]SNR37478.1 NADH-FMN oxidoreductase RutF, flavin reductase (DIM6/NTAB) family [Lutibacter flavus]
MNYFNNTDINSLEHLYKINLINSCAGYKSANLIATKSTDDKTNLAIFSSVIHLGSSPPLLGFILRPTSVPRNTYENIMETGYFTINHIHEKILKDAHHTSAKYDKSISEFDVTDLETDYKNNFYAPFVKNSPIQLAMKYLEEYDIKSNNTKLVIGEIQGLYVEKNLIEDDGFINLSKGAIAAINGLDGYSIPNLKERLEYQRPKK